jgi:hypothetical protein
VHKRGFVRAGEVCSFTYGSRHVTYPVSWGPWLAGRDRDGMTRDWAVDSTHEADCRRVPLQMWADIVVLRPGVYSTIPYLRLHQHD